MKIKHNTITNSFDKLFDYIIIYYQQEFGKKSIKKKISTHKLNDAIYDS